MIYNINWSAEAQTSLENNIDYLRNQWNESVIADFAKRVVEVLSIIESDPELFPLYKRNKKIYRCVVTEQITLYYKIVDHENVELQIFWNVYQNPKKLKLK